jgi:hypothetical protein
MCCIVVKRGEFRRYETLYKAFSTQTPVIWDRRVADRRRAQSPFDGRDRRAADRRALAPLSWQALKFVVIDDAKALTSPMAIGVATMR